MERRAWGGTTIKAPEYNLDVSRAGFVYCGANLFNSLRRITREEKKPEFLKIIFRYLAIKGKAVRAVAQANLQEDELVC